MNRSNIVQGNYFLGPNILPKIFQRSWTKYFGPEVISYVVIFLGLLSPFQCFLFENCRSNETQGSYFLGPNILSQIVVCIGVPGSFSCCMLKNRWRKTAETL